MEIFFKLFFFSNFMNHNNNNKTRFINWDIFNPESLYRIVWNFAEGLLWIALLSRILRVIHLAPKGQRNQSCLLQPNGKKARNGILFTKLFWPSVWKNWSSDWEKRLVSLDQFVWTVKGRNDFWNRTLFKHFPGGFSDLIHTFEQLEIKLEKNSCDLKTCKKS